MNKKPLVSSLISQPIMEESEDVISAGSDPSIKDKNSEALSGFIK
jgi:hypothetical protein